jgi:flavin-dependent dehydrogenase
MNTDFDVIIIGGGLAGLTAAILLSLKGKKILLIEKEEYPFQKVCGEYISNEVLGFLSSVGFDPFSFGASKITKLRISAPSGKNFFSSLDLGGFGLSRFVLDHELFKIAVKNGTPVLFEKVIDIAFHQNRFAVKINSNQILSSRFVIGSYGKRSVLDKRLNRDFLYSRTGYLAVKYHLKSDYPVNEIGLDNFKNGYCGIVKIENEKFNLCYLFKRDSRMQLASIQELEKKILFKNPVIKNIFDNSEFISTQPEVISEISFASKNAVENHILMCGDSAGLITPLCGNGMSMAIHSAKLLCETLLTENMLSKSDISLAERTSIERKYQLVWNYHFKRRLFWGKTIQNFLGNPLLTNITLRSIHAFPKAEQWLIANTHGKPISDYNDY